MKLDIIESIGKVWVLICLLTMSIEDVCKQEIRSIWLILFGIFGFISMILVRDRNITEIINCFLPGGICFLLAWMTREQIGYGDAFLILAFGLYMDFIAIINICLIAFSVAGLVSAFLLFGRKKCRGQTLPLIPFLSIGYIWVCWCH